MKKKIYLVALIGLLLDQSIKIIVSNLMTPFTSKIIIKNFFELTFVKNTGGAWGILSNNLILLIFVSIVALLVLNSYIKKEQHINNLMIFSYGFLIGGILGNLIDRLFRGYVVDFFHFYIFGYDYPVFNIADILIVVGISLMLIEVIRGEINELKSRRKQ